MTGWGGAAKASRPGAGCQFDEYTALFCWLHRFPPLLASAQGQWLKVQKSSSTPGMPRKGGEA
jgi:hypothetical protein